MLRRQARKIAKAALALEKPLWGVLLVVINTPRP